MICMLIMHANGNAEYFKGNDFLNHAHYKVLM